MRPKCFHVCADSALTSSLQVQCGAGKQHMRWLEHVSENSLGQKQSLPLAIVQGTRCSYTRPEGEISSCLSGILATCKAKMWRAAFVALLVELKVPQRVLNSDGMTLKPGRHVFSSCTLERLLLNRRARPRQVICSTLEEGEEACSLRGGDAFRWPGTALVCESRARADAAQHGLANRSSSSLDKVPPSQRRQTKCIILTM